MVFTKNAASRTSRTRKIREARIKKSKAFNGLNDLKLDAISRRRIDNKALTNEQLVKIGRDHYHKGTRKNIVRLTWSDVLSTALDKAGYIRHDLDKRNFLVGRFYRRIYILTGRDTSNVFTKYEELASNTLYEACQFVTDDWFYHLMYFIDENLSEEESQMVKLHYGFMDGEPWSYGNVGRAYNVNHYKVRQIIHGALLKLDERGLPSLLYA